MPNPLPKLTQRISPTDLATLYLSEAIDEVVALSQGSLVNQAYACGDRLGLTTTDRICLATPLHTAIGFATGLLPGFAFGSVVVLPSVAFDAEETLRTIEVEQCSVLHVTAAQLQTLVEHPNFSKYKLATLKKALVVVVPGATPANLAELLQRAKAQLGIEQLYVGAGLPEAGLYTMSTPNPTLRSLGVPLPARDTKLVDGELLVKDFQSWRAPVVRELRWVDSDQQKPSAPSKITNDGWLRTGLQVRAGPSGQLMLL